MLPAPAVGRFPWHQVRVFHPAAVAETAVGQPVGHPLSSMPPIPPRQELGRRASMIGGRHEGCRIRCSGMPPHPGHHVCRPPALFEKEKFASILDPCTSDCWAGTTQAPGRPVAGGEGERLVQLGRDC